MPFNLFFAAATRLAPPSAAAGRVADRGFSERGNWRLATTATLPSDTFFLRLPERIGRTIFILSVPPRGSTGPACALQRLQGSLLRGNPAHLFVFVVTEHLAGLWIDQMYLSARKATHLSVSEIIVIRLI